MFELNYFNGVIFRQVVCSATGKQDDALIRLFVAVDAIKCELWFEVLAGRYVEDEFHRFANALAAFNKLLE